MAFTYEGWRGDYGTKTVGSSTQVSITADIGAGDLAVVALVTDNGGASGGNTSYHTAVNDSQSNTYTKIYEYTITGGGAGDGVTTSLWFSELTTALTTAGSDTVTGSHSSIVAHAIGVCEFSTAGSVTLEGSTGTSGTGTAVSTTIGSLTSRSYLLLHFTGLEEKQTMSWTADADYNATTIFGSGTAGAGISNVCAMLEYRMATLTGDTCAPTAGVSADWSTAYGALYEDVAGDLAASASDTVALTDAPVAFLPWLVGVTTEAVTVADIPVATVSDPVLAVSDAVAVADSPTASLPDLSLSVSEAVTVADSPAVTIPTTYYIDATSGSDSYNGLYGTFQGGSDGPWQTISKVNGETFNAGDEILFKRGEEWRAQLTVPSAGASGNPITFGAYGTGNDPIINGSDLVTSWSNEGSNVWSAALTTNPSHVFFDDVRGTQETAQINLDAANEWYWDTNVLYVYSTSDPDTAYTSPGIEAAVRADSITISSKNYVALDSLRVTKSRLDNIVATSSDGCTFTDLEVDNANENGLSLDGCDNCTITGGHYHHNGTTSADPDYAENIGCNILVFSGSQYNTISDLESDNAAEDGVGLAGPVGYYAGTGNEVNDCNLHDNLENGVDCKAYSQSISGCTITNNSEFGIINHQDCNLVTITGCVFEDNGVAHSSNGPGSGNRLYEVYGCWFKATADTTASVALTYATGPHKFHYCIFDDGANNRLLQIQGGSGHEVYNCVFYNVSGGAVALLRFTTSATNVLVKNNAFYSNGYPCIRYDTGITVSAADNNSYYRSDSVTSWLDYQGTFYDKADIDDDTVYAEKGTDQNSITGDPLWLDPGNGYFQLQSGSGCRNAGTNVGLTTDYAGVTVPQESVPDIGAYEYVPSLVVSDSITVSDTPTVNIAAEADLEVSKSEAVAVSDSPLAALDDLQASTSDSATVTDTPAAALPDALAATAAEAITTTDAPAATLPDALAASASEIIATSDTPEAVLPDALGAVAAEAIAVSDTPAVSFPEVGVFTVSVADSIAVSDSPIASLPDALAASTSEAIAVSDSASADLTRTLAVAEAVSVADTPAAALPDQAAIAAESVTVADAPTVRAHREVRRFETITVADAATARLPDALAVGTAEAVTVTDSAAALLPEAGIFSVSVSDAVAVADSPAASPLSLAVTAAESVAVADTAAVNMTRIRRVVDAVAVSETVTITPLALAAAVSEAVAVAEAANAEIPAIGALDVAASDSLTVADSPAVALPDLAVGVAESVALADSPALDMIRSVGAAEAVGVTDAPSASPLLLLPDVAESIAVADSPLASLPDALAVATAESIAVAESVSVTVYTGIVPLSVGVVETIGVVEALLLSIITMKLDVGLSDSARHGVTTADAPAHGVSISDALIGRVTIGESTRG